MIYRKQYGGRLGNNLFHYAYTRCLAERMGYALRVPKIDGFEKAVNIDGTVIKDPRIVINYKNPKNYLDGKMETLDQLAKRCQGKRVELIGGGMNVNLYEGQWGKIRKWLGKETKTNLTKNDLVVHVRLGDFLRHKNRILPIEYYKEALKSIQYNKLFVCSDDINHKILTWLRRQGAIFIRENAIDTFRFIESANKIIISNSSYSWWAAALSNADEIIVPTGRVRKERDLWTGCEFTPFPKKAKYAVILGKLVKVT